MPSGTAILAAAAAVVAFGCCDAGLLAMGLPGRTTALWLGAMAAASLANLVVPSSPRMEVNGAAVVVASGALWIGTAGRASWAETRLRVASAAAASAAVLFGLAPWALPGPAVGPPVNGIAAGLVGALAGRTPRAAVAGTLVGIPLAGLVQWVVAGTDQLPGPIRIGGGSAFDAGILAAAVALGVTWLATGLRSRAQAAGRDGSKP